MKFKTKTEMLVADFDDLWLAHQQGTVVEFRVNGRTYGGAATGNGGFSFFQPQIFDSDGIMTTSAVLLLTGSIVTLLVGAAFLYRAVKIRRKKRSITNAISTATVTSKTSSPLKTPLIGVFRRK